MIQNQKKTEKHFRKPKKGNQKNQWNRKKIQKPEKNTEDKKIPEETK